MELPQVQDTNSGTFSSIYCQLTDLSFSTALLASCTARMANGERRRGIFLRSAEYIDHMTLSMKQVGSNTGKAISSTTPNISWVRYSPI